MPPLPLSVAVAPSFQQFKSSIDSPALVTVVEHWHRARQGRLVPTWADIDAMAIFRQLPIVWAWRWDEADADFIGRVAGEEIETALGCSIHEQPTHDVFPPLAAPMIKKRYLIAMRTPALLRTIGTVYDKKDEAGTGEWLVLPMATSDGGFGGVMGATAFEFGTPTPREALRMDYDDDREFWLPLKGAPHPGGPPRR